MKNSFKRFFGDNPFRQSAAIYSVLIFLFGAHFTFVYNRHKGRTIRPDKNAVAIKIQEIERGRESVARI